MYSFVVDVFYLIHKTDTEIIGNDNFIESINLISNSWVPVSYRKSLIYFVTPLWY